MPNITPWTQFLSLSGYSEADILTLESALRNRWGDVVDPNRWAGNEIGYYLGQLPPDDRFDTLPTVLRIYQTYLTIEDMPLSGAVATRMHAVSGEKKGDHSKRATPFR